MFFTIKFEFWYNNLVFLIFIRRVRVRPRRRKSSCLYERVLRRSVAKKAEGERRRQTHNGGTGREGGRKRERNRRTVYYSILLVQGLMADKTSLSKQFKLYDLFLKKIILN